MSTNSPRRIHLVVYHKSIQAVFVIEEIFLERHILSIASENAELSFALPDCAG